MTRTALTLLLGLTSITALADEQECEPRSSGGEYRCDLELDGVRPQDRYPTWALDQSHTVVQMKLCPDDEWLPQNPNELSMVTIAEYRLNQGSKTSILGITVANADGRWYLVADWFPHIWPDFKLDESVWSGNDTFVAPLETCTSQSDDHFLRLSGNTLGLFRGAELITGFKAGEADLSSNQMRIRPLVWTNAQGFRLRTHWRVGR